MTRLLVTSALPYANGDIHIGHLVEYIQTDIFVRFQRLIGNEALYVCASDAHGTPIEINAKKRGIRPEELVEHYHSKHQEDFARFEVGFDEFYTTDSPENRRHSETIYLQAKDKGHVDDREIEQYYCESCGRFLPDRFIKGTCPKCKVEDQYGDVCESCGATYSPTDLADAKCAICGAAPALRTSKHFFFRLKDFRDFLLEWTSSEGRLQDSVRAFVRNWIDQGLDDWDISRDGPYFGFEIPGEQNKYFYVWLDAPVGYIAATEHFLKSNGKERAEELLKEYWLDRASDVEIHHFIGKDISYFHTLFWPAMLEAAQYRLPEAVHVHGFLTVDGRKMSKSRGTFVTARLFAEYLNPWYLRYYYATKLNDSIDDLDLNIEEFVHRNNAELVNNVTNLISRTIGFLNKRLESKVGSIPEDTASLVEQVRQSIANARTHYEELKFGQATREILAIADISNNYIQHSEPWAAIKNDPERARDILTFGVNSIKAITTLIKPILPELAKKVEEILGVGELKWDDAAAFDLTNREIGQFDKLIERLEPGAFEKLMEASRESLAPAEEPKVEVPEFGDQITIDDFAKVDLRAAKILAAEAIEGADKLMRLEVDLGREKRVIIAGIKKHFKAEELVGRTVAVVANLKPRKMKFGTSHGMVLAGVDPRGHLALCEIDSSVAPGSKVQ